MSNRNSISSSLSSSFKSISRHDSQLSRKKDRDSYFDENDDEPIYFVDQPSAALICKCCEAVFRTGRGPLCPQLKILKTQCTIAVLLFRSNKYLERYFSERPIRHFLMFTWNCTKLLGPSMNGVKSKKLIFQQIVSIYFACHHFVTK